MKQKLFSLLICLLAMSSLKAQFGAVPYSGTQENLRSTSEDLIKIGYCSESIDNGVGGSASSTISAAILIPKATFGGYAGKKITKIRIGLAANSTNVSVWIRSSLTGANLVTVNAGTVAKGWKEVSLPTPYTIPDGDIYVGYTATGIYQIGFSGESVYDGCWLLANGWDNYASNQWGSLCIQALVDTEGQSLLDAWLQSVNKTYAKINEEFSIKTTIRNNSTEAIQNLKIAYTVGTDTPVEQTIQTSIPVGEIKTVIIPANAISAKGVYTLSVSILEVNGQTDTYTSNNTLTNSLEIFENTFPRKVVMEEGTGSWCGWCPRGTVAMENMREKYPDSFIGLAIHNGDAMTVTTYDQNMTSKFFSGFPKAVVNRKMELLGDPYFDGEEFFLSEMEIPSQIGLELTGEFNEDLTKIDLKTTTTFANDATNVNLKLAYVLVENGVTGYTQSNYYAGGGNGPMGGFENRPSSIVDMVYNDVARGIYTAFNGITGSIPTTVTKMVPEDHTYSITLPNSIKNKADLEVVVMLINAAGEIENADKIVVDNSIVPLDALSTTPVKGATNIAMDAILLVTFNKNITVADASKITINGESLASEAATAQGRVLSIAHNDFDYATDYTVKVASGAIDGLTKDIEWSFTSNELSLASTLPRNNQSDINLQTLVSATFNDNVEVVDLNLITINEIPVTGASVSGKVLSIPHEDFAYFTIYTVTIPTGAIKGLLKDIQWKFRTVKSTGIEVVDILKNASAYIQNGLLMIPSAVPILSVTIYTTSGQKVLSATVDKNTVPVAHLASGVYVVKLKTIEGEKVLKVIK
jgi:hypothetical protein